MKDARRLRIDPPLAIPGQVQDRCPGHGRAHRIDPQPHVIAIEGREVGIEQALIEGEVVGADDAQQWIVPAVTPDLGLGDQHHLQVDQVGGIQRHQRACALDACPLQRLGIGRGAADDGGAEGFELGDYAAMNLVLGAQHHHAFTLVEQRPDQGLARLLLATDHHVPASAAGHLALYPDPEEHRQRQDAEDKQHQRYQDARDMQLPGQGVVTGGGVILRAVALVDLQPQQGEGVVQVVGEVRGLVVAAIVLVVSPHPQSQHQQRGQHRHQPLQAPPVGKIGR